MVFKSKLPSFVEPTTGLYQFLFSNPSNVPDDKPMLFDGLDPSKFLTYSQLKDYSLQFAAGLQDVCDFKDDDVLALYASSRVTLVEINIQVLNILFITYTYFLIVRIRLALLRYYSCR